MRFSLQTRELIADSIETITCAQFHDANISIPGCDKNMPGVVVGHRRLNKKQTLELIKMIRWQWQDTTDRPFVSTVAQSTLDILSY